MKGMRILVVVAAIAIAASVAVANAADRAAVISEPAARALR